MAAKSIVLAKSKPAATLSATPWAASTTVPNIPSAEEPTSAAISTKVFFNLDILSAVVSCSSPIAFAIRVASAIAA